MPIASISRHFARQHPTPLAQSTHQEDSGRRRAATPRQQMRRLRLRCITRRLTLSPAIYIYIFAADGHFDDGRGR